MAGQPTYYLAGSLARHKWMSDNIRDNYTRCRFTVTFMKRSALKMHEPELLLFNDVWIRRRQTFSSWTWEELVKLWVQPNIERKARGVPRVVTDKEKEGGSLRSSSYPQKHKQLISLQLPILPPVPPPQHPPHIPRMGGGGGGGGAKIRRCLPYYWIPTIP